MKLTNAQIGADEAGFSEMASDCIFIPSQTMWPARAAINGSSKLFGLNVAWENFSASTTEANYVPVERLQSGRGPHYANAGPVKSPQRKLEAWVVP
jgi:hypothetical protein